MFASLAVFALLIIASFVLAVLLVLIAKILLADPAGMRDLRRMKVSPTGRLIDPDSVALDDRRCTHGLRWNARNGEYERTARFSSVGLSEVFK